MKKCYNLAFFFLPIFACSCDDTQPQIWPCGEGCEVEEELVDVTAKVIQWPITCDFVLTTDSASLLLRGRGNTDSTNTFIPCNGLPLELQVNDTLVTLSGYRYDCYDEFAPNDYSFWQGTGNRFEITSIKASSVQFPLEPATPCNDGCDIEDELIKIKARVFRWGITCEYVLETDSSLIADETYLDVEHWSATGVLVPCNEIPKEYVIDQLLVTVSGYKYNCCQELIHPLVKPGFGCRFEITAIEAIN